MKAITKRSAAQYQKTANALYLEAWRAIWGIPKTVVQCSGVSNCTDITLKPSIDAYSKAMDGLYKNNLSLAKALKKGKDKKGAVKLTASTTKEHVTAMAEVSKLPTSTSSCVR